MKTIPRTHKAKIANYRGTHTKAVAYSLAYDFIPRSVSAEVVWDHYVNDRRGKLKLRADGALVIDVHANLWYELTEPDQ